MFEKQVAEILERVLGAYFEEIDTSSLHVSVFSGKVVLDDLRMRSSAFSALGLPLRVKHGHVRHVELDLSLRNLRGTPAHMRIDGIEVVVDPSAAGHAEADALQAQAARRRALQKDRDSRRQALVAPKDGSQSSATSRLVTAFISNLVIHLSDVHVRFETPSSTLGARMQAFALMTADAQWAPANVEAGDTELFKQAQITQLSIYTQSKSPFATEAAVLSPVDLLCRARLMLAVPSAFDKPLMSVDCALGTAQVLALRCAARTRPRTAPANASHAHSIYRALSHCAPRHAPAPNVLPGPQLALCSPDPLSVLGLHLAPRYPAVHEQTTLTDATIRDIAGLLDSLESMAQRQRRMAVRPVTPGYRGHYAIWWRYAIGQVRDQVGARTRAWRAETVTANARRLRAYVPLFRRSLAILPLPVLEAHEEADMEALEEEMSEHMVLAIRTGVQNSMQTHAREALNQAREHLKQQPKPGLLSRLFGRRGGGDGPAGGGQDDQTVGSGMFKVNLTKEERSELEQLLESKAVADAGTDAPATWAKLVFSFTFDAALLQLSNYGSKSALVHAKLAGLCVAAKLRSTSSIIEASLQSATVQNMSAQPSGGSAVRQIFGKAGQDGEDTTPLLFLEYVSNPLECDFETSVKLRVERSILVVDVELLGQLQAWWTRAVAGVDEQSAIMHKAREYAAASVLHAQSKAHDAFVNALTTSARGTMRMDLHLSAPTILVPFDAAGGAAEQAEAQTKVRALAAASIGVMRIVNGEPHPRADVYEASLSGMRVVICKSGSDVWHRDAAWRHDPGLVAPFTLAVAVRVPIREHETSLGSQPPMQVTATVTAVQLTLSERDCQWAQDLVRLIGNKQDGNKWKADTPVAAQPGADAGGRLKLLKSASLPFEFSDSFIAEAKRDANTAAPTKLQKGLSYTEGQSAQAPLDTAGRRRYVFQLMCPPQLAKLRKEKSTGSDEVAKDWDRYAQLQRLQCVFKTESVALELTRQASKERLLLIEARALEVNAIVRSLSMDLTVGLADVSIQDLLTPFLDDARGRVVAKSGCIHAAADAGAVDTASVPECLSLGVSVYDRQSPGYKGTDVAYKAALAGFAIVCSAQLVHLCSKWATDAFRLHSAVSNDHSVAPPVSAESAESQSGTAAGAGDGIDGSMSTDVSVGRLDVSFVTVEGGRCAQLGMLEAVGLSVEHRQSWSEGVLTKVKVEKLRALDTRSSASASLPSMLHAGDRNQPGSEDSGCRNIFGSAYLDDSAQRQAREGSASSEPLVNIVYEMPPASLLVGVPKVRVDVQSSRLLADPEFFAECIELYAGLSQAASSAFRQSVSKRLVRSSMRAISPALHASITRQNPPVMSVNVSAIMVSAAPPSQPSNVFTFQMNGLRLKGKHDSQHFEVARFRLSSKRNGDDVWHTDFGGKFSKRAYTGYTDSDDLVCFSDYSADFDQLNFMFDPLAVSLLTDIWQHTMDNLSAPLAMWSEPREQGGGTKVSQRRLTSSGASSSQRLQKLERQLEQLKIQVKVQCVAVDFVLMQPSQKSGLPNGSALALTNDCLSIVCTGIELAHSKTTERSTHKITSDVSVEDLAIEFKKAQSDAGTAESMDQDPAGGSARQAQRETSYGSTGSFSLKDGHLTSDSRSHAQGKYLFSRVVSSERLTRLQREMRRTEEEYRRAFRECAGEGGKIDPAELVDVLRSLGANVTERIARNILVQLDADASGTLSEGEFLKLVYLVTRSQTDKDTAQGSEESQLPGVDAPAIWKAIRMEYRQEVETRAHVQLDVQRIEVSLTREPLQLILALLDEIGTNIALQARPPEDTRALGDPSVDNGGGLSGGTSEPLAENVDVGLVSWLHSIRERAFMRKSDTIQTRPMDITLRMGPVDVAVIPHSDTELLGQNALVVQLLSLEFSSKLDRNTLPCENLRADGLTVVLAEFPLGPPDGDIELIPPSTLEYALSHELDSGVGIPDTRISFDGQEMEITCAQIIWLVWLVNHFSAVTKRSTSEGAELLTRQTLLPSVKARCRDGNEKRVTDQTCSNTTAVKLAHQGRLLFTCSDTTWTLKTFSNAPIVQVGWKAFTITSKLQEHMHLMTVECEMNSNVMSELKHVWEAAIEPCALSCQLISHRNKRKQDLEIACDETIQISVAPDHIYSLAQTSSQLETAFQTLANGEYSPEGLKYHEGSRGTALSDFFGAFMPAERVLFMNSTNLMIHVRIETADDMDDWEAPVAACSSVMIPKSLLQSYGIQLRAVRQTPECATYKFCQALFVVPDETSPGTDNLAASPLIQVAVCDSESSAGPVIRLQLRSTAKSILVHCPWVVENLCPVNISVSTFLSTEATATATNVAVIPAGESQEQYSVDLSPDKAFYLAVSCDGCTPISRARIQQAQDDCDKVAVMQDSAGRELQVRIKVYVDLNNDTVISVHPQMVIVNRCGVPLRYGRGRLLDSASPAAISAEGRHGLVSANGLYIEEAARHEMVPEEDLHKPRDGKAENWNRSEPQVVMFSLPEGPEWSPCVCLSGSDSWVRISRAVFGVKEEEEDDDDEEETSAVLNAHQTSVTKEAPFADEALNLVSHIQLDVSDGGFADIGGAQRAVELAVGMHVGAGSFHSCVYMEIMPDITVINNTAHVLEFARTRQGNIGAGDGASLISSLQVAPGEQLPYHGIFSLESGHVPHSCGYSVSLLADASGGGGDCVLASLPFRIAEERVFPLSLWSQDGRKSKLDVLVKRWSGATFVSFSEVQEQQPWYQVKNRSAHHYVHIVQGSSRQTDIERALAVAPGQTVALSWDNPEAPRQVYAFASASLDDWTNRECGAASLPGGKHRGRIDMDRLGELVPVLALPDWQKAREHRNEGSAYAAGGTRKHTMKQLLCATTILGHTRVLEFHDETEGRDLWRRALAHMGKATSLHTQTAAPSTEGEAHVLVGALVKLGGLGVSVVDTAREELVFATFGAVSVSLSTSADALRVCASVSTLQIDNASMHGPRTALVSPSDSAPGGGRQFLNADLLLSRAVTSVRYWRAVSLSISPVTLQLHEEVLWTLLQFEHACYTPPTTSSAEPSAPAYSPAAQVSRGTRYVAGAGDAVTGLTTERAIALRELAFLEHSTGLDSGMHFEEMRLAPVAVKVTLLGLNAIQWRSLEYEADDGNVRILAELYSQLRPMVEGTLGVPDVEGHSMELPALLCSNRSVAHGGSLVTLLWGHYRRSVMVGGLKLLGSPAFWSSLLGDAGDTQQKRKEKIKRNARKRNQGPVDGVGKGLAQGLQDAGGGLWEGVTGVVTKPWEAATTGGWDGFGGRMFGGISAGVVGLVAKPATGVINLTSKVVTGVSADLFGGIRFARVRPPRPAYWDSRLRAYCKSEALVYNSCAKLAGDERCNSNYLQLEGFVGAARVFAREFRANLDALQLRDYDYLVFSRTHVRVLANVEDAAAVDTQEARVLTELALAGSDAAALAAVQVQGSAVKFLDANKGERLTLRVAAEDLLSLPALLDRFVVATRERISVTYLS